MSEFAEEYDERTPLYPKNRYVVLEEIDEDVCGCGDDHDDHDDEAPSTVLVPEEFLQQNVERYKIYMLEETAPDCTQVSSEEVGARVLVDNTMVEKLVLDGEDFILLQENYIYGVLG